MKRFSETSKWEDKWFRSLDGAHKLVFLYIIDRCDNAGFWEIDDEAMEWHTKLEKRHYEGAYKALARTMIISDGWVMVRTFLKNQKNEELNPANAAHRQIVSLLKKQASRFPQVLEILENTSPINGASSPSVGATKPPGIGKGQVMDKDKDKEGVQRKEISGKARDTETSETIPANLDSPEFKQRWETWKKTRKNMGKKPKDWGELFTEQILWLGTHDAATAIEILGQSIRNNWQGLFPPKNIGSQPKPKKSDFIGG